MIINVMRSGKIGPGPAGFVPIFEPCVLWLIIASLVVTCGCLRRDGRNSDCSWPGESVVQDATPWHLSADAEFAEDLAIRFADVHHGLRSGNYVSGAVYNAKRDECMRALFERISEHHRVPVQQVSSALGRNRAHIDAAVNLPFGLLYIIGCFFAVRLIWRRYPPSEHGWIAGAVMAFFGAVMMAAGGTMLGEMWAWLAESYRIGNGHMSYRASRLWPAQHRPEYFISGLVVFWLIAGAAARWHAGSSAKS